MLTAQEARDLRVAQQKLQIDEAVDARVAMADDKIRRAHAAKIRAFTLETDHAVVAEVLTSKLSAVGYVVDSSVRDGIITLTARF